MRDYLPWSRLLEVNSTLNTAGAARVRTKVHCFSFLSGPGGQCTMLSGDASLCITGPEPPHTADVASTLVGSRFGGFRHLALCDSYLTDLAAPPPASCMLAPTSAERPGQDTPPRRAVARGRLDALERGSARRVFCENAPTRGWRRHQLAYGSKGNQYSPGFAVHPGASVGRLWRAIVCSK